MIEGSKEGLGRFWPPRSVKLPEDGQDGPASAWLLALLTLRGYVREDPAGEPFGSGRTAGIGEGEGKVDGRGT